MPFTQEEYNQYREDRRKRRLAERGATIPPLADPPVKGTGPVTVKRGILDGKSGRFKAEKRGLGISPDADTLRFHKDEPGVGVGMYPDLFTPEVTPRIAPRQMRDIAGIAQISSSFESEYTPPEKVLHPTVHPLATIAGRVESTSRATGWLLTKLASMVPGPQQKYIEEAVKEYEKPGRITQLVGERREYDRERAYQRSPWLGRSVDAANAVTDLGLLFGEMAALGGIDKIGKAGQLSKTLSSPKLTTQIYKRAAKQGVHALATTPGSVEERARAAIFRIGFNLTPFIATKFTQGIPATVLDAGLNVGISLPSYIKAGYEAENWNEFLSFAIPDLAMNIGMAVSTRKMDGPKRIRAMQEQQRQSDLATRYPELNMTKADYDKVIRAVDKEMKQSVLRTKSELTELDIATGELLERSKVLKGVKRARLLSEVAGLPVKKVVKPVPKKRLVAPKVEQKLPAKKVPKKLPVSPKDTDKGEEIPTDEAKYRDMISSKEEPFDMVDKVGKVKGIGGRKPTKGIPITDPTVLYKRIHTALSKKTKDLEIPKELEGDKVKIRDFKDAYQRKIIKELGGQSYLKAREGTDSPKDMSLERLQIVYAGVGGSKPIVGEKVPTKERELETATAMTGKILRLSKELIKNKKLSEGDLEIMINRHSQMVEDKPKLTEAGTLETIQELSEMQRGDVGRLGRVVSRTFEDFPPEVETPIETIKRRVSRGVKGIKSFYDKGFTSATRSIDKMGKGGKEFTALHKKAVLDDRGFTYPLLSQWEDLTRIRWFRKGVQVPAEDRARFSDIVESGISPNDPSLHPNTAKLLKLYTEMRDNVYDLGKKYVNPKLQKIENYYPLVIKEDIRNLDPRDRTNKLSKLLVAHLQKSLLQGKEDVVWTNKEGKDEVRRPGERVTTEEAWGFFEEMLNFYQRRGALGNFAEQVMSDKHGGGHFKHAYPLELHRRRVFPDWAYETDAEIVVPQWLESVSRSISLAKHFEKRPKGYDYKRVDDILKQIANDDYSSVSAEDTIQLLFGLKSFDPDMSKAVRTLKTVNIMLLSLKTGLKNFTDLAKAAAYSDNIGMLNHLAKQYVIPNKEHRQLTKEVLGGSAFGVTLKQAGITGKFANAWTKAIQFQLTEKAVRKFQAGSAINVADRMLRKYNPNATGWFDKLQKDATERRFKDWGIDLTNANKRGHLTHKEKLRVGLVSVMRMQPTQTGDLPFFWSSTKLGSLFTQYKPFGMQSLRFMKDYIIKEELGHGNPLPAARFAVYAVALGLGYETVRSFLYPRDKKDEDEGIKKILWDLWTSGHLGFLGDMMFSVKYAGWASPTVGFFFGPTASQIVGIGQKAFGQAKKVTEGKMPSFNFIVDEAARRTVANVPIPEAVADLFGDIPVLRTLGSLADEERKKGRKIGAKKVSVVKRGIGKRVTRPKVRRGIR